jgi:hypothetical protein
VKIRGAAVDRHKTADTATTTGIGNVAPGELAPGQPGGEALFQHTECRAAQTGGANRRHHRRDSTARVGEVDRVVPDIGIEVDVTTGKADRVLTYNRCSVGL